MRSLILFILTITVTLSGFAQYTKRIHNCSNNISNIPYNNQFDYSWCTVIYPQNMINISGDITDIYYDLFSISPFSDNGLNQKIYMAHTTDITFTDAGYPNTASMTLVYDGTISYATWEITDTKITLTTPFTYNNKDNLIIHLENRDGAKHINPDRHFSTFSCSTPNYPCKYNQQDGSFPATSGNRMQELPVVSLTFAPGLDAGISKVMDNKDFKLPGTYDLNVKFRNYRADIITSVDIEWELSGTPQTTYNWTGSLIPGQESATLNLAPAHDFAPGIYTVKVWTSIPNAGIDEDKNNDTLEIILKVDNMKNIAIPVSYDHNVPTRSNFQYGWSASIYKKREINFEGNIFALAYSVNNSGGFKQNQKIYLSHISDSTFSTADYPDVSNMTLVYDGSIDFTGSGWKKIMLDTVFNYNNTDNLLLVYENHSNTAIALTYFDVDIQSSSSIYNNNTSGFPVNTGSVSSYKPILRLYYTINEDAGITNIDEPVMPFPLGTNSLKVSMKNFGNNILNSADIVWQVDAGTQNTFNWTGNMAFDSVLNNINIGSNNFGYGMHNIKVWTTKPNNLNDYNNNNDTISINVKACYPLNGNYVIGTAPSDFTTIKAAVDSLNNCGVTGPVTFNIKPGTYNSQYVLHEITGASAINTITFKSQIVDSTSVVVTSDSADFTFKLDGADYIIFKNLTFTSDSSTSNLVVINNKACNNLFIGNRFIGITGTPYLIYSAQEANSIDTANVFDNNYFLNGNTAIYLKNDGSALFELNNKIINNTFINQTFSSIDFMRQDGISISKNYFNTNYYAISGFVMKNNIITKNNINTSGSSILFWGATNSNLIANNFIICKSNGTSIRTGGNVKFYNNTVKSTGVINNNVLVEVSGSNNDFKNNILINLHGGKTIYVGSGTGNISDNNCLFSNGEFIADWLSTPCAGLAEWQAISGQDLNSISILPSFVSETDLHTNAYMLDGAGTYLTDVTDDYDGQIRNLTTPDIGADEFSSTCPGSLSGEYVIGTSGDYITINDAVKALNDCGVSGSVVFNIKDGTYNEQLVLKGTIPGYTKNDKITFQSQSGDSTKVILSYKADTLHNYTVKLDGADGIIFKQISIQAEDTAYGRVVEFGGSACNNIVQNCIIRGTATIKDDVNKALVYFISDNVNFDTGNVLKNNVLIDNSYGICLNGNQGLKTNLNRISGNHFINQSAYGIHADYQKNLLIEKNIIENNYQLDIYYYGINIGINTDSTIVRKNKIHIDRDYNSIGMNFAGWNNLILNNFISIRSKTYHSKGISGIGIDSKCYNNSINMLGSGGSTALDVTYSTLNAVLKNNLLSNMAGGYAIYCLYGGTQIQSSDYNNLYSNGPNTAYWLGTAITGLSEWKAATGFDNNSISSPAHFVSDIDLHTTFILFNKAGTPLPEVYDDIDGNVRDITTPDIGADEFFSISFSLGDDVEVCVDKSYKIDAGIGFDTYDWSTGATSASITVDSTGIGYGSKKYYVTVMKGTDQFIDTIKVSFSSPIATPITDYCFLTGSTDTVSAGIGKTYVWNTGDSTQKIVHVHPSIWNYYITVTDENGCTSTGTIHIRTNPMLANMQMPIDTNICSDSSITLHAIPSGWSCDSCHYLWSTGDTTQLITIDSTGSIAGTHNISVNILYGTIGHCSSSDQTDISFIECPKIKNIDNHSEITVYPNPTTGIVYIDAERILEIKMTDLQGKLILNQKSGDLHILNLSGYPKGLYFMEIVTNDGIAVEKIVVE